MAEIVKFNIYIEMRMGIHVKTDRIKGTSLSPQSINKQVEKLKKANQLISEAKENAAQITQDIRNGFNDVVVVFIDLVDSTHFKILYKDEPEKWILRLMQFSEFLTELIEDANGKVVKYIGDEVMAVFSKETMINDALNLVTRIDEIQESLAKITGHQTKVKIAVDKGQVYLVKYTGHEELDPQGTPVDRCSRIARYAQSGTIVTSFEFQKFIAKRVISHELGNIELKGLGAVTVYQLFDQTIKLEERLEVNKEDYTHKLKEIDKLQAENSELIRMNRFLQKELDEVGVKPSEENSIVDEDDDSDLMTWERDVAPMIKKLQSIMSKADVPSNEYSRFLFLYFKDNQPQKYNSFEGQTFDSCIDSNLVIDPDESGYYYLNKDNKLNKKAITAMNELEEVLILWEQEYPDDEDFDEYDCSLTDPKFWKDFIHVNVLW